MSKAVRDYTFGGLLGGGVTLAGTWRLKVSTRLHIFAGAGTLCGLWRFCRSLNSSVDDILALDGSRMQKELANIIVTRYPNNPRTMQHIFKHFYYEEVFDDSTLDRPKRMLRYRNFFSDIVHAQRTNDNDHNENVHGNSHHDSSNRDSSAYQSDSYGEPDDKGNALEFKPVLIKRGTDAATADPLNCIFGTLAKEEEIQHSSASNPSPKSHSRSRRYNRRHRRDKKTMPTNFEHV